MPRQHASNDRVYSEMSETKAPSRVDSLSPSAGLPPARSSLLHMSLGAPMDAPFSFDCESKDLEPTPSVHKPPNFPPSPIAKQGGQLQRGVSVMHGSSGHHEQHSSKSMPDEATKQILNTCTPDQLEELSKLTPGALQNLKAIVTQFMASQKNPDDPVSDNQHHHHQQMAAQMGHHMSPNAAQVPRMKQTSVTGAAIQEQQMHQSQSLAHRNMSRMAGDMHAIPMSGSGMPGGSQGMQRLLVDKNTTPRNVKRLQPDTSQPFDFGSPRFAALMNDFGAIESFGLGAAPMQPEEEMVISPRSARMLLNAVREGSGIPPEGAAVQQGRADPSAMQHGHQQNHVSRNAYLNDTMAAPNYSSSSGATGFGTGSAMQFDEPRQETSPRTPRTSLSLTLQPFDSLLRGEDDETYLGVFNSWMSKTADEIGRPFGSTEPQHKPEHSQMNISLAT